MTEPQQQPSDLRWVQFRDEILTAREVRRRAAIDAARRFVDLHPMISRRPRLRAAVEARLQLREDLVSARFDFRRAVLRSAGQLASSP